MLKKLLKKTSNYNKLVKSSEVKDVLTSAITALSETVMSSLDELNKLNLNKDLKKNAFVGFKPYLGVNTPKDVLKELIKINELVATEAVKLNSYIDAMPDKFSPANTTIRNMVVISLVESIVTYINFQIDFLLFALEDGNENYGQKKLDSIKMNISSFGELAKFNSTIDISIRDLSKINNELIINEGNKSSASNLISKDDLIIVPLNAIVGVIYNVRKWWINLEIKKYEVLKEKKALLELRVIELKNGGEIDDNTKDAIDVYLDKIQKLEIEIKQIEDN